MSVFMASDDTCECRHDIILRFTITGRYRIYTEEVRKDDNQTEVNLWGKDRTDHIIYAYGSRPYEYG